MLGRLHTSVMIGNNVKLECDLKDMLFALFASVRHTVGWRSDNVLILEELFQNNRAKK